MAMVNVVTVAAYRWIYWLKLISLVQRPEATWCLGTNLIHDFTAVTFSVKLAFFR